MPKRRAKYDEETSLKVVLTGFYCDALVALTRSQMERIVTSWNEEIFM